MGGQRNSKPTMALSVKLLTTPVEVSLLELRLTAATGIFGGTVSLFENTLRHFGVETKFVDAGDTRQFENAIDEKTRLIFVETIANPRMDVPDYGDYADPAFRHVPVPQYDWQCGAARRLENNSRWADS